MNHCCEINFWRERCCQALIIIIYLSTFIALNLAFFIVWALSVFHSHLHYWLCYVGNTRVTTAQFWRRSVISRFSFSRASFSNRFFFIRISHFFCTLSFISQSKFSLWTPNYEAYHDFNFDLYTSHCCEISFWRDTCCCQASGKQRHSQQSHLLHHQYHHLWCP
jgi:hypothetical protein